ncbi:MAG TPA: hypothetical protein VK575_10360 [Gemmatimonadaceae bacterium]|nr:hypothetical protein [Gemmatimonadaceae bacterium]
MRFIRSRSTVLYGLLLVAIPTFLSGCFIITGSCADVRFVSVAGSVMEGGLEVAGATVDLNSRRRSFDPINITWQFRAPTLEGHITSAVLVNSTRPVPILLNLPIREPIEPWGYQYAYFGTMDQHVGDPAPLLGGIHEVLAANEGVLELTTDLPSRPLVRIPLAVTNKADWHEGGCRS